MFILNLEKKRGNQSQIRNLVFDEKEIDGDEEILKFQAKGLQLY